MDCESLIKFILHGEIQMKFGLHGEIQMKFGLHGEIQMKFVLYDEINMKWLCQSCKNRQELTCDHSNFEFSNLFK